MKQTMYLVVWRAIQWDAEWKQIYERLVSSKCRYDERTRRLIGREKVIGRKAGPNDFCHLCTAQERSRTARTLGTRRRASRANAL